MPLVYRTLASVPEDDGDLVAAASAVFSRWLSKRGNSGARVDFTRSAHYELSNRSRALVVRHDNPEEGLSFLRLTTESDKPDGVWRTTASVVVDPELSPGQHLWIDMTVDPAPREESPADQPRLDVMPPEAARMLLQEVAARDGTQPLPAGPRIVRGRDDALVDTLVSAIRSPDRRLAVVATGTPRDVTVAGWREAMAGALARSTGMCAGYVLDAAAIERVGGLLPRGLDIPTGGVRTFLPAVDVADESDHPRHPRMSPATLDTAREGDRVRNWVGAALSRRVRETALAAVLPPPLAAVDALLAEETTDLRLRALSRADRSPLGPPGRNGGAGGNAGHVRTDDHGRVPSARHPSGDTAGGLASVHEREAQEQLTHRLREEVKRQGARIAELSDERQELLAETADLAEEVETAREQLRAARFEARWLRERIREEGLFRLAATPAPRDPQQRPPVTVRELLDRITDGSALPHLFFTIEDHDTVHELEDSRKETLWVTRAWEALLALNDYARYQFDNPGSGLGFHSYLRETPDGYQVIPVKRLASQESDYVRNRGKLNEKRLFRVPTEVEPSGRVPMYAHIKLDIEYGICPRLYFYPHLGPGTTNRVYIGYLGRHLPVQQSN